MTNWEQDRSAIEVVCGETEEPRGPFVSDLAQYLEGASVMPGFPASLVDLFTIMGKLHTIVMMEEKDIVFMMFCSRQLARKEDRRIRQSVATSLFETSPEVLQAVRAGRLNSESFCWLLCEVARDRIAEIISALELREHRGPAEYMRTRDVSKVNRVFGRSDDDGAGSDSYFAWRVETAAAQELQFLDAREPVLIKDLALLCLGLWRLANKKIYEQCELCGKAMSGQEKLLAYRCSKCSQLFCHSCAFIGKVAVCPNCER